MNTPTERGPTAAPSAARPRPNTHPGHREIECGPRPPSLRGAALDEPAATNTNPPRPTTASRRPR